MMRTAVTATVLVAALAATACQAHDEPAPPPRDDVAWLTGQPGVAAVESLEQAGPGLDPYLRVTVTPGLGDAEVEGLVSEVKEHFASLTSSPDLELAVDGFVADVVPATYAGSDEVEQALWLRSDGRALSSRHESGSTDTVVVAPPADVVALAVDYDDHSPLDPRGYRHRVESPDLTVGVRWDDPGALTGPTASAAAATFVAAQRTWPGTTGWLDVSGASVDALIDLDPADIALGELTGDPGAVVPDRSVFDDLQLGWGPARAVFGQFARTYSAPGRRALAEELATIPGVLTLSGSTVEVSDGPSYDAVLALSRRGGPTARVSIELRREPDPYDDGQVPFVFTSGILPDPPLARLLSAVAAADDVDRVELYTSSRRLVFVQPDIDDTQLRRVLRRVAALRPIDDTSIVVTTSSDYQVVGDLVAVLRADATTTDGLRRQDHPDLAERVERIWTQVG